jgi:hypothetical protein
MSQSHPNDSLPTSNNGRDAHGRFAAGNGGGPGNPFARQVAKLRAALVQRVSEADMQYIAERLIVLAKSGDLAAAKLLFLYVLGKPAEAVNPDTLDVEEWRQCYQPLGQIMKEMPAAMGTLPAEVACGMVAHIQPCRVHELAETLSLPQEQIAEMEEDAADIVELGQRLREAVRSCHDETNGDNTGQQATRPPSPNGGDGAAAKRKSPSANGHHGVKPAVNPPGPTRRGRRDLPPAPAAKSPASAANGASVRSRPKPGRPGA